MKKKITYARLPMNQQDLSHVKPPTRPAIEAMIENLHNADKIKRKD
ncbi:MAG: hypothetical protein AAB971_02950 [Patescibacteria group bacterium]